MNSDGNHTPSPARWTEGPLPANIRAGVDTLFTSDFAFKRFLGEEPDALCAGAHCTFDGVHFAIGKHGNVRIGDYCYLTNVVLLCEQEVQLGSYVVIGWNATIADTDFHPLAPAERIADAIACSPEAGDRPRPPILAAPVIIEDDVWIGPNAAILKGVTIGRGAWIEPGAVITRDVPPGARMVGNPAQCIGTVEHDADRPRPPGASAP